MKVSKNELLASLKKAFEALGFQPGDYYDAADMVVWLETHGFYGFDRLLAALTYTQHLFWQHIQYKPALNTLNFSQFK